LRINAGSVPAFSARRKTMSLFRKHNVLALAVLATLALPAVAQDQDRTRTQDQLRTQDQIRDQDIYGSQLMTQQERSEYRNRMRTATTAEERERIRNEHHAQMKIRAKERGVTIPDQPPARGMGGGMGPGGGGMGPGGRR
jgi:hypothetical protein